MSSNPSLYRYIDFIGGNILDSSNVLLLQTELGRLGLQGLGQLYAQGTLLNAVFNITGTSIVFTGSNPSIHVFAFINGQFEDLGATVTINGSQPVSGSSNPLYLNWSWDIKTNTDDATFVDGTTGEPTIEAGQLSIDVDWSDTSGTPINPSTQFGKNTVPIVLATFDMSVAGHVTPTYINGVAPYAWGNPQQAGFVRLTDNSGLAPGNTDSRLSDARNPLPGSVYNSSVASLISSGTNSTTLPGWTANTFYTVGTQIVDSNGNVETVVNVSGTGESGASAPLWNVSLGGQTIDNAGANQVTWVNGGTASTTKYDPATPSQGGIFTDSIIYNTLKEKLTTFLDSVNTNIENALIALTNHIGKPLGSSVTHPFPTALQVGAAPSSHVGQVLGLGTSHPAQVNSDHAGFVVLRNPAVVPASTDAAFQLTDGSSTLAAVLHGSAGSIGTADFFAQYPNTANAQGGNGSGGTAVYTGTLGLMSLIAQVLAEHVNYKTHGNNNPHNLDAADIGSVDAAFVDAQVSSIIDSATAYTDSKTNIAVRTSVQTGRNIGVRSYAHHSPGALPANTQESMTYVIFTFGGGFELALGTGNYFTGGQVALPEASGWSSGNFNADVALQFGYGVAENTIGLYYSAIYNPSTRIISVGSLDDGGANFVINDGWATVTAFGWRFITPPAIIITSFDNTAGTFNAGHVGDTVTITGRNFGSVRGGSTVAFNGTPVVSYTSWSSTSLVVVVPVGATTGVITVTVGSAVNSPFVFTIS